MGRHRDRDVYQRGGKWWGVIPRDDGEAERRSLRLSASAPRTEAIARWLEAARVQRSADKSAHTPRVGALFDAYVAEQKRRGRSEATREIDETKAGHFIRLWGGTMPTHNITASLVAKYIEQREEEGANPRTIQRELIVLRGALKLAIHRGTFTTPLERVMPLGYAPKYVPRTRWLSWDEAHRIFDELTEDQHRGWFAFTLGAGARKSETEKAKLSDITTEWVYVGGTKTPDSDGAVPVTSFQRPWLELAKKYGAKHGPAFGVWTNVLRALRRATERLSTCPACRKKGRGTPVKDCLLFGMSSYTAHRTRDPERSTAHARFLAS
jgi:hypothetical protein